VTLPNPSRIVSPAGGRRALPKRRALFSERFLDAQLAARMPTQVPSRAHAQQFATVNETVHLFSSVSRFVLLQIANSPLPAPLTFLRHADFENGWPNSRHAPYRLIRPMRRRCPSDVVSMSPARQSCRAVIARSTCPFYGAPVEMDVVTSKTLSWPSSMTMPAIVVRDSRRQLLRLPHNCPFLSSDCLHLLLFRPEPGRVGGLPLHDRHVYRYLLSP